MAAHLNGCTPASLPRFPRLSLSWDSRAYLQCNPGHCQEKPLWQGNIKSGFTSTAFILTHSLHSSKSKNRHHKHPVSSKQWNTPYMLLCFPGELTDRLLFWLREPPMATAGCLPVASNGGDLLRPDKLHLCFSLAVWLSLRSPQAPLSLITHLSSGEHPASSPLFSPLLADAVESEGRKYTCSHVNSSARAQPLRSNVSLSRSSCTHTHSGRLNRQCL